MKQLETTKKSDSSSLNRSASASRSARSKHITTWEIGEASSSQNAEKKAMPVEIAQSSQEWHNHHIQINQEQRANEIHSINEEASSSQHTPEHREEVKQELDRLIEQYGNDPKHLPEMRKALLEFLVDKISSTNEGEKMPLMLNFRSKIDEYFWDDENPNRMGEINDGIYKFITEDIYKCSKSDTSNKEFKGEISQRIENIQKLLGLDRQTQEQPWQAQWRREIREQRLADMYGWRLYAWRWLQRSMSSCVRPNQQEQGHEHQE